MPYSVEFTSHAVEDISKLDKVVARQIVTKIRVTTGAGQHIGELICGTLILNVL
jgi:mRNA-degrading endonuclease RelE of RelBE toxin-antitoxin system